MCTLSELVSGSDGVSSQWVWDELKALIEKFVHLRELTKRRLRSFQNESNEGVL